MIFLPLMFVVFELFLIYAVLESTVKPDPDKPEQDPEEEKEKLIAIFFTCYFVVFYLIGTGISA